MKSTQFLNVKSTVPLIPPRKLREELPMTEAAYATVVNGRETIQRILTGDDSRLLVVVGPCSIHDEEAAMDYAGRLARVARDVEDQMAIVMRVYFEKPRTVLGWKGLISDPALDGSMDIEGGLRKARRIFLNISDMGLCAGTEVLDPITPPFISDLIAWAALGARTTESQTHRQMASGLSMPIGYKNGTDGDVQIAIDAMEAARHPHSFIGIDLDGQTCVLSTTGNTFGHMILRGGRPGPNYDKGSVAAAAARMAAAGVNGRIVIDCSHDNSFKDYRNQERVWDNVIEQVCAGSPVLAGLMLESNIREGKQKLGDDPAKLEYGVSITDGCIGWEDTERMIRGAHAALASIRTGV